MKIPSTLISVLLASSISVNATENPISEEKPADEISEQLKTDSQKVSYAMGAQFGLSILHGSFDLDLESFVKGYKDNQPGNTSLMDTETIVKTLNQYRQNSIAKRSQEEQQQASNQN